MNELILSIAVICLAFFNQEKKKRIKTKMGWLQQQAQGDSGAIWSLQPYNQGYRYIHKGKI